MLSAIRSEKLRRAREINLAIIWLNIENAYGSIPQKLVELTLQKLHVPDKFQQIL
jgi:hypothetical protein